jgi:hypothetical protein
MRRAIRPVRRGLTRRVEDRLAQFATDGERTDLFTLPRRAFKVADRMLRERDGTAAREPPPSCTRPPWPWPSCSGASRSGSATSPGWRWDGTSGAITAAG